MLDNNDNGQDVDLNLAPIIDCFTVLITYLLMTASFLTLTALDVSVSANSDTIQTPPSTEQKNPMFMTLDMNETYDILLTVSGGNLKKDYEVKIIGQHEQKKWDEDELYKILDKIQVKWNEIKEVSISAAPSIKYKDLVSLINSTQKKLPKVYISGG